MNKVLQYDSEDINSIVKTYGDLRILHNIINLLPGISKYNGSVVHMLCGYLINEMDSINTPQYQLINPSKDKWKNFRELKVFLRNLGINMEVERKSLRVGDDIVKEYTVKKLYYMFNLDEPIIEASDKQITYTMKTLAPFQKAEMVHVE